MFVAPSKYVREESKVVIMHNLEQLELIGFFDLETTGLDVKSVRIVTASVGLLNRTGELVQSHNWLVNPGVPIPHTASQVHGITDEIAIRDGEPPLTAVPQIVHQLELIMARGLPVVAFNAAYDFSILTVEARRLGLADPVTTPVFDPLVIDRRMNKYRIGKRTLAHLAEHYQIPLVNAHTAEADAIAAARLALRQIELYPQVAASTATELHAEQSAWADEQAADFESYMQQRSAQFKAERGWPVRFELS